MGRQEWAGLTTESIKTDQGWKEICGAFQSAEGTLGYPKVFKLYACAQAYV